MKLVPNRWRRTSSSASSSTGPSVVLTERGQSYYDKVVLTQVSKPPVKTEKLQKIEEQLAEEPAKIGDDSNVDDEFAVDYSE